MNIDKRQFTLQGELRGRLDWYWEIRDKVAKQMLFAPKSSRRIMSDLIFFIDKKAMPIVRKLLQTIGNWERQDAQEFYQINAEVCRLTDLLNYDATDEEIQTWKNPNLNFLT